eukprot:3675480-Prymnesium_polylepis.2
MSLCDYELQRLANIASNQALLVSLGLGKSDPLIPQKPVTIQRKRKYDSDEDDASHSRVSSPHVVPHAMLARQRPMSSSATTLC